MNKNQPSRHLLLFGCAGWLLAAILLAGLASPGLRHRLAARFSHTQPDGNAVINARKAELQIPWKDTRPLIIIAGDSHVELGDWYELFHGTCAIRNCGLSGARIPDVADLVSAIGDSSPEKVVLLCGINDLGAGTSVDTSVAAYRQLISSTQASLHPKQIIALSVMPLTQKHIDLNRRVADFNRGLQKTCEEQQVQFLDVTAAVSGQTGALAEDLTGDGLHLNHQGYLKLAARLEPVLRMAAPH